MAQDPASDVSPADLPEPVGEWLASTAEERGIDESELLGRLLAAAGGEPSTGTLPDDVEDRLDDVLTRLEDLEEASVERERLDDLEDRIDDLDAALEEKIEDVRSRVVQVKRETDAKAQAEHEHAGFERRLADVATDVEALADDLSDLEARLDERTAGEEAYREEAREAVADATEDVSRKLDVLASTVLDLRDQASTLAGRASRRAAVDQLADAANRHGVTSATCESCGGTIQVALLSSPTCPHCDSGLRELDPKRGFFGSNVLRTGTPPALEGDVEADDGLDDLVED